MKKLSIILLFCISAIYASATRDTVYVEQIVRDTVYIPIKSKTDTIYIKKDVAPVAEPTQQKCCTPTEDNPLGADTTKYPRNDTTFTRHRLYLHFDLISIPWLIDTTFTSVGGNLEASLSRKTSAILNLRYSKIKANHGHSLCRFAAGYRLYSRIRRPSATKSRAIYFRSRSEK